MHAHCSPGEAVTFFTEEDAGQLRSVANLVKEAGGEVPDWMMQLKKDRNKQRQRLPPQVRCRGAAHPHLTPDMRRQ